MPPYSTPYGPPAGAPGHDPGRGPYSTPTGSNAPYPTPTASYSAPAATNTPYSAPPAPNAPYSAPPAGPVSPGVPTARPDGYGQFMFPDLKGPGVEPLAVASLITFPLGPIGLGLGIAALRRVRRNRKRSPAMAGTGIVLGLLSTAAAVLTIITLVLNGTWEQVTQRPEAGDTDAARVVASANVASGNCLRTLPVGDTVGEVTQVPCSQEHQAQAVAVVDLPDADWEAAELLGSAAAACADGLAPFADEPHVQPWFFVPSERGWQEGSRTAVCLLRTTGPALTTDYIN